MKHDRTFTEALAVFVIAGICCALIFGRGAGCGCGEGYSEGERTGVVTKCSYKGLMSSTKSWEAEMNLGGLASGADGKLMANIWEFTVADEEVLKKVQEAVKNQKPITIKYTEWLSRPGCRSSTGYFATEATYVELLKAKP